MDKDKRIEELEGALRGLVGDTGIIEDNCNCDNGHEKNGTVCDFCWAKKILDNHSLVSEYNVLKMFQKWRLELVKESEELYSGKMNSPSEIVKVLIKMRLDKQTEENLVMLALDTKNNIIGYFTISIGSVNASIVHPREIFKRLLSCNASHFILAHNHPSGDTAPSKEDLVVTERLKGASEVMGIDMLDHIILGENGLYNSLRETGFIK